MTSSPARFAIDPDEGGPVPLVSTVNLGLPDPNWVSKPFRVFTNSGTAVGAEVLWAAPGEPAALVFDSSQGFRSYFVYVGSDWPALPVANPKAGVWMESRAGDGKTIDHLPDMLAAWNHSVPVLGRALVGGIFQGGNRFGVQRNLLEHFQGWFELANAVHLDFAIIASDATFVLVDGKEVVEWPGLHDFGPGLGGQHQGGVDLAAGLHSLDYYNAYVAGDPRHPVLCCLAVKGGTLPDWTMLRPNAHFFRPEGSYHSKSYEVQVNAPSTSSGGNTPALAISWVNQDQSVISTDMADVGFISMQLTCLNAGAGTLTWTFDDGSTAQGPSVAHLFPRPGMRVVHLARQEEGKPLLTLSQTISVHPSWAHPNGRPPELDPGHEADIIGRDAAVFSASDLAGCFAIFSTFDSRDGLLKLLPAICGKMKEMKETDLPYIKDAALLLTREDWMHVAEETQLLRALMDRLTAVPPSPSSIAMSSECRLALAQLLLKTTDQTDEVRSLVDGINAPSLSGNEPRALAILRADLSLATGDIPVARKQYEALTGPPSGPDARSSIRRTAKIGQARVYLERPDFDAAEDSLKEVAWQSPIEKMAPDWALTRLRLDQEEKLPGAAYLWAKRLLPVMTESGRSELLFRLTDLAFAQNDDDLAHKTLSELLKKHPYSEEAAQAKQKWPGKE